MAHSAHTPQQKQMICEEARRMTREGVKFTSICTAFNVKPTTLRAWINNQTRDWLYPQVHNQGRM